MRRAESIALWKIRARRVRALLSGCAMKGETFIWARDLAPRSEIPESGLRRMGLRMIDQLQVEGFRVRYAVGAFMIDRPRLEVVE